MTPKRRPLPCLAVVLLVWANLNSTGASPAASAPSSASFSTTSFPKRTPAPSGVIIDEAGARRHSAGQTEVREKTRPREPPGSPVKLFMPDEFQFYTLNANGQLVMKQMTKQEIQGMIAVGAGNAGLSDDHSYHPSQLPGTEPKVSDVVQNVQKVLKHELNKPTQAPASESSIPGSVNSQWTNMLAYILSGGSVDQQHVAQDTNMVLPALDADQTYVDVIPLHNEKPSETENNYISMQSALNEEQEIKLITPKPSTSFTSGKPLSLLGNMALDNGILGGQEIHSPPTKAKPYRPTTTHTYHKYTTAKPIVPSSVKDNAFNLKNSSANKPTLYIPLSVSPSLLADTQNKGNYGQSSNSDVARPSNQEKNTTTSHKITGPPKKPTTYVYSDQPGFTRLPMIQVPVIEADKLSTSTQRTNQHQTPMFEILPTISPGSVTSSATTTKEASHPSKLNLGPIGGFKKPEMTPKPSTQFRPQYEPITRSSTAASSPTYRPVYEPPTRPGATKTPTSTNGPTTKPGVIDSVSSTMYRPSHETKPSSVAFKPTSSFHSTYESSTLPGDRFKVTQDPSPTYYTTGKASTVSDLETKFISTPSGLKVTEYPEKVYQATKEESPPVIEIVTKVSVESSVSEVINSSNGVRKSTVKNKGNANSVDAIEKEPDSETTNKTKNGQPSFNNSTSVVESETSTVLNTIDNDDKIITIAYTGLPSKLPEKIFDSTDKKTSNGYDTTAPSRNDEESETPTLLYYNTEKTVATDSNVSDEQLLLKTESYVLDEDSSTRPTLAVQPQDSKPENTDYHTVLQEVTTKEPEIMFKQTDSVPAETTETIVPSFDASSQKSPVTIDKHEETETTKYVQINQKDGTDAPFEATTKQFVPLDGSTTDYSTLNYESSDVKIFEKKPSSIVTEDTSNYKQETTVKPLKDSTTYKLGDEDSTKMYDLPIDTIVNYLTDQLNDKKPGILISGSNKIFANQENSPTQGPLEKENTAQKDTIADSDDNYQSTKVVTENSDEFKKQHSTTSMVEQDDPLKINSTKENEVTPFYEKMETITQDSFSIENKFEESTLSTKENEKGTLEEEEEISTVKVIPVYDDGTIMYTLPSDVPSKTTLNLAPATKPVQSNDGPITVSSSSYSPDSNFPTTYLPELQEALNNYMKEHYDPKYSTTSKYDDIPYFTTIVNEDSLDYKKKLPTTPTIISDHSTTTEYQKISQKPQIPTFSAVTHNEQNTESSILSSTPVSKISEGVILKENSATEQKTIIDNSVGNKSNIETPIIYLELTSSKPEKQSMPNQKNKEYMTNSSLTRIKTQNPLQEVDKIISGAPAVTSTPATVPYTLSSDNPMPNNIASGLIAGYPTYSQGQPMAEYIATTKSHESIEPSNLSTTNKPMELQTEEYTEKDVEKTTLKPLDIKNESITNLPPPLEYPSTTDNSKMSNQTEETDDQINDSFNPPLEKLSDLINQLNDYSVATTIVPMDNFEAFFNDSSATPFESLNKTFVEPEGSTYVMLPTLSANYTTEPFQSSTKSLASSALADISKNIETTTQSIVKSESNSTVRSTTLKKIITEKSHTTSTRVTTKGPIEKVQSTIDKSAGRINLEEEKIKLQQTKPTEPSKFPVKNKFHYTTRRPVNDGHSSYTRKATKPLIKPITTPTTTTTDRATTKSTDDSKESTVKWTLIPQNVTAEESGELVSNATNAKDDNLVQNSPIVPLDPSLGEIGLDQSNKALDKDVAEFLNLCNEISFKFWNLANNGLTSSRSVTLSPFGMISTLAMIFFGARGTTSIQMNDILKLDDVVTFNPHLVFQNITDTVTLARGQGIENAAFVRVLFADRLKVRRIMPFYKEQAQQFYEGAVVDINFSTAGDILRRRTNWLIRKQTGGRIKDFVKSHTVPLRSPLTALSANVFQTSCDGPDASSEGRDGEMYFAVAQTVKQRKLVPIPAVVWKSGVSAGYEPSLDATAIALGDSKRPVSMVMVMPGQQGVTAPGDNLEKLESRLFGGSGDALEKLLKVVIPRRVEVQMPKFSHRSIINVTSALKNMGFEQLFIKNADLKGINGAGHDLFLADMIQMNLFCTCGDENKLGNRHLSETYPGTSSRHTRTWELLHKNNNNSSTSSSNNNNNNGVYDSLDNRESDNSETSECDSEDSEAKSSSENSSNDGVSQQPGKPDLDRVNSLRQKMDKKRIRWFMPSGRRRCRNRRQTEPEKSRMKVDKPFLYLIRHNLSGLILHIGRFNPKSQS
ncbi:mucin-17 [Copidosoma floridanum]|uniref:mucin-17 n=1 Tax=Copidosoma floridanum TaxID=29053 RepID=UPI000C6F557C|nr:mucin-17 [Copidosoma floridanum]